MLAAFADPVHDSQACFRAVLDATARPGTFHAVTALPEPPPGLHRATAAVLLTLADHETGLWIGPDLALAEPWLRFHCGAPPVPMEAAAILLATALPDTARVAAGSDEEPERGATIILQGVTLGEGASFTLDGPGLAGPTPFRAGLPPGFAGSWQANHARFPRGFDLILCCGDRLAALPRSVSVREG